jgi:CsoR family transcriptional regulator, copper-sensing transcriptional repressor
MLTCNTCYGKPGNKREHAHGRASVAGACRQQPLAPSRYTMRGYSKLMSRRAGDWRRLEDGVHGYTKNKDDYLARLRRIEGQVRGLQRMVDEDKYCIDILTQVSAATKALQSVALGLLDEHLGHCVTQAVAEGGDTAAAKVREASDAISRLVRSG